MSHVHRLRSADRIFFVTVNLRRVATPVWTGSCAYGKEFNDRLTYMHLNPVRKGLATKPEDWRWSSYNNFAVDKGIVISCPIQIDYVQLPDSYRG